MQMKVSTLKAKSALFDVNKIKGSENKILTATKDIRKDYDSSRGFGLATLTAITTYKDPKQGFKSRDEFESRWCFKKYADYILTTIEIS